jgi:hypothetical protein
MDSMAFSGFRRIRGIYEASRRRAALRWALGALAGAAIVASSGQAWAQAGPTDTPTPTAAATPTPSATPTPGDPVLGADNFKIGFYDVATSAHQSRSGYGGVGSSGGEGDSTVRIVNTASASGTLCAMIYVFDDSEELQTCCGCPVTPDGLRTLSVVNDLTSNFGVNRGNLNAGVIDIVSATLNWTPGNPPPAPNPPGTNGPSVGTIANGCSPTGTSSNDPFGRASGIVPTTGLRAWVTRDELAEPGNIPGGQPGEGTSTDELQDAPLDSTHLASLQSTCSFLIRNGSGAGFCTCGVGDSTVAIGSSRSR